MRGRPHRERVGRVVGLGRRVKLEIAVTMRSICPLSARPNPHTDFFTSAGGYPAASRPARPHAASTAPRAWPTERIVRGFAPTYRSSSAAACGW